MNRSSWLLFYPRSHVALSSSLCGIDAAMIIPVGQSKVVTTKESFSKA
jgi:hypothetical protein